MAETVRNEVIFLLPHPPTTEFARRFFVEPMRRKGWVVRIFDVGRLVGYRKVDEVGSGDYQDIGTWMNLVQAALRSRHALFVVQISLSVNVLIVRALLKILGCRTLFFGRGYMPHVSEVQRSQQVGVYSAPLRNVLRRLLERYLRYDVVFTAGSVAENIHRQDSLLMVPIHHFDVDLPVDVSWERPDRPYAVFLDSYLPKHPDFARFGLKTLNEENYYRQINEAFEKIENRTGLEIVISAHPRANYERNPFRGRRIVYGVTKDAVRNSSLSILHASTSITFAVLYEVPIILMTSNEIKDITRTTHDIICRAAELLNCSVHDLSSSDEVSISPVDESAYARYFSMFVSNVSNSGVLSEDVVTETMDALCKGP